MLQKQYQKTSTKRTLGAKATEILTQWFKNNINGMGEEEKGDGKGEEGEERGRGGEEGGVFIPIIQIRTQRRRRRACWQQSAWSPSLRSTHGLETTGILLLSSFPLSLSPSFFTFLSFFLFAFLMLSCTGCASREDVRGKTISMVMVARLKRRQT